MHGKYSIINYKTIKLNKKNSLNIYLSEISSSIGLKMFISRKQRSTSTKRSGAYNIFIYAQNCLVL